MRSLTEVLTKVLEDWAPDTTLAWAGECGLFGDAAYYAAEKEGMLVLFDGVLGLNCPCDAELVAPPGVTLEELKAYGVQAELNHVWLTFEGRHYDAASLEGVATPFDLRHFRQVAVEVLRREHQDVLARLSKNHEYWRQSELLFDAFMTERAANACAS